MEGAADAGGSCPSASTHLREMGSRLPLPGSFSSERWTEGEGNVARIRSPKRNAKLSLLHSIQI